MAAIVRGLFVAVSVLTTFMSVDARAYRDPEAREECKRACDAERNLELYKCSKLPVDKRRACFDRILNYVYPRCLRNCDSRGCLVDDMRETCIDDA